MEQAIAAQQTNEPVTSAIIASESSSISSFPTEIPAIPPDTVTAVSTDIISSVPGPLQYGDLAALGLAGWSPAGICRWSIELLQVTTGLSWFWTFIDITIISRLLLFPFTVVSMQNTAKLAPFQTEVAELRQAMQQAQARKDQLAMQRAVMQQKLIYDKAGVKMGRMAMLPFVQLPVTLGMFFGVKTLCDLPLAQLKYSGFGLITDFTIADPTYVLPVISAALMNLQLSVSSSLTLKHAIHLMVEPKSLS